MRIVHVEDFFHPDAGYQLNLLAKSQARQGHDVSIVCAELSRVPAGLTAFFGKDDVSSKDRRYFEEFGVKIVRLPILAFVSGRALFFPRQLFSAVKSEDPEVVMVHGAETVTGVLFVLFGKWQGLRVLLDSHMLEMASVNRFSRWFTWCYRLLVTPVILEKKIPLVRVADSDYVERHLGIPLDYTQLLPLGSDLEFFAPDAQARADVRTRLGIRDREFVVVYAGKLDSAKGALFLADAISEVFNCARDVVFLIIGNPDAEIEVDLERRFLESENKVIRLPTQRYVDLPRFFAASDLAVFPKQCSLSFFDAQASGLPVLLEDNEINRARAEGGGGELFRPSNVEDFRLLIERFLLMDKFEWDNYSERGRRYVEQNYNFLPVAEGFSQLMQSLIDRD